MGKAKYIIEGLNQGSLQPPPPLGGRALPLPLDFLSPLDEVKGGAGGGGGGGHWPSLEGVSTFARFRETFWFAGR